MSVLLRIEVLVHGIDRTHRQSPRYSRLLKSQTEFQQKWVSPPAPGNSFGVRLRASCLLSGRFDHAQPPTTRLSLANLGNSLSPRHFAENAALGIDVGHFSSVVYEWRLPCMPEYVETWIPATDDELMQGRN